MGETPSTAGPSTIAATPRKKRPRQRWWGWVIKRIVSCFILWCLGLYFFQDRLLFPADAAGPPDKNRYSPETVEFERPIDANNRGVAWFVPAYGATRDRPAALVVYFHGNAELIDHQFNAIEHYRKLGCNVLLPEYRGYGRAKGHPGEAVILDDAEYFLKEALKQPEVDATRLVFHGRSLGGGPAALLAQRHTPRLLILESTFTSAAAMAHHYWAPGFMVRNPLHVDRAVESLDIPILMFHGRDDDIIPVWHGRALRDLARHGRYIEFDCRHNDFPGDHEEDYWREIVTFLKSNGVLKAMAP